MVPETYNGSWPGALPKLLGSMAPGLPITPPYFKDVASFGPPQICPKLTSPRVHGSSMETPGTDRSGSNFLRICTSLVVRAHYCPASHLASDVTRRENPWRHHSYELRACHHLRLIWQRYRHRSLAATWRVRTERQRGLWPRHCRLWPRAKSRETNYQCISARKLREEELEGENFQWLTPVQLSPLFLMLISKPTSLLYSYDISVSQ